MYNISPNQTRVGVIDIGSNSVRLVVYDALKRVPMPLFNEKMLCGLALGLEKTGKLHPGGVILAHKTLARFIQLSHALHVKHLHVIATAAVRDAADGQAFVRQIEQLHQIKIRIFSGEEEANYAALGIMAAMPEANGMVGDLGGGSLELTKLEGGKIEGSQSFPLGVLRLLGAAEGDRTKTSAIVERCLHHLPLFNTMKGGNFYAVGGGFRNLAKIYIALTHYPLRILHHYIVPANKFLPILQDISKIQSEKLESMTGISGRRAETLPYTALIMESIITKAQPANIVFSAYGIREGFLFDQLSKKERQKDPLIAGCTDMITQIAELPEYGHELCAWMTPLFPGESAEIQRLRLAASILSGLARYEHTEYRAEISFRRFIDSSITGINHPARLFIATALFHRYKSTVDSTILEAAMMVLEDEALNNARIIGLAMRLGHNISAGMPGILYKTSLSLSGKNLVLRFDQDTSLLMGEAVQKRLNKLAQIMRLTPIVVLADR